MLFGLFCFLWILLLARAAYLQFLPQDRLSALQTKQFQTVITLPPRRGAIVDRNGKELAMSSPAYSLYADPKLILDKKDVAKKIAKILEYKNYGTIYSKIKDFSKRFVWLERLITIEKAEQIKNLKIHGLGLVEEWKRIYPNEELLSSTLGFVGKENQALEGLELFHDSQLKGEKKKLSLKRDARGRPLIQDGLIFTESPQGKQLKLTIDSDLQYFVQSELNTALKQFQAEAAYAVVLDAKTSAIRAIASLPDYNPNIPFGTKVATRRNRSVTDTFEPGSTLKTFVIAEALDKKLYTPESKIFCENGSFKIGKRVVHEAEKDHARGLITVSEILAFSSNIGTSKIALNMGDKALRQGLFDFGFGSRSGVDLPGEAKGISLPLPWHDHLISNISFGQGITASPLQLANAYAVIANGGMLRKPFIVESVTDPETNEVVVTPVTDIRRVISESTADQMRAMLVGVTQGEGTGLNAAVSGFLVAGKTGTAQKIKPAGRGYIPNGYIASFAGFIPANDPQYVIFVAFDHPKKGLYGSAVAAPVFSRIASYAVRQDGLTPDKKLSTKVLSSAESGKAKARYLATEKAIASLKNEKINDEEKIIVKMEDFDKSADLSQYTPDLKTHTVREVLSKASEQKLNLKFVGKGRVDSTWPQAGEELPSDRKMMIYLKE